MIFNFFSTHIRYLHTILNLTAHPVNYFTDIYIIITKIYNLKCRYYIFRLTAVGITEEESPIRNGIRFTRVLSNLYF